MILRQVGSICTSFFLASWAEIYRLKSRRKQNVTSLIRRRRVKTRAGLGKVSTGKAESREGENQYMSP